MAMARPTTQSGTQFWFGLFVVLLSGQYLANLLHINEFPTWQLQVGSVLLSLTGLALFSAGGFLITRGLGERNSRIALATAALLIAVVDLYPLIIYGNPFSFATGIAGTVVVLLGLLGSLALLAAAVWFALTAAKPEASSVDLRLPGFVLLGAIAVQKGIVPLLKLTVSVAANTEAVGALARFSLVSLSASVLPTIIRALAAGIGLFALWLLVSPVWMVGNAADRGADAGGVTRAGDPSALAGLAGLAVALWGAADILLSAALWSNWASGLNVAPPVALRLQTMALILLPATALLVLGWLLSRNSPNLSPTGLDPASGPG